MGALAEQLRDSGPCVVTEEITREGIQVDGDPEAADEKRRSLAYAAVEHLALSFRRLVRIENLQGLARLTRLQLDNNQLTKIENLEHLVNLTWLDLSFNQISKIEGLDTLTALEDLSLFSNRIETLEGLKALSRLAVLSLGSNNLASLQQVMYLRQFRRLRLLTLAGNPLAADADYRPYVLSHLRDLTYLDHRRVQPPDVQAAMEQHQDEVLEIMEREEAEAVEAKTAAEASAAASLMQEANLGGVDTLLEDLTVRDPEWGRLGGVPGLLDSWGDTATKVKETVEDFKGRMLEQHQLKAAEYEEWARAVAAVLGERDAAGRLAVVRFEKLKKAVFRQVRKSPGEADSLLREPLAANAQLEADLMAMEMGAVSELGELVGLLERNYTDLADACRNFYTNFFAAIRDLDNRFFENAAVAALAALERYNAEGADTESLPEAARALLADKEVLTSALQALHDSHTARIDALEDRLIQQEAKRAADLVAEKREWAERRNRARVAEVIALIDRHNTDLESLLNEDEAERN